MSNPTSLFTTTLIGFALGLRHALDTDHLVAVSTLVARERSFWRSTATGAIWGLGHTATLFVMGLVIIVAGWRIPDGAQHWLELSVAAMLILLGARTLYGRAGDDNRSHHSSFTEHHAHPSTTHLKQGVSHQSFWVGMIHGLSGSAELMLLVLATIRHPLWALLYIATFGLGMMSAMFALTAVLARLLKITERFKNGWQRLNRGLHAFIGACSLGYGSLLLWQLLRN